MQKRIYLASPYSSDDPALRESRYKAACSVTAQLLDKGNLVFSPIVHSHMLAENYDLAGEFVFWSEWCLSFLRHWATHFAVLELAGWQESKGIAVEKRIAEELGLPMLTARSDFFRKGQI